MVPGSRSFPMQPSSPRADSKQGLLLLLLCLCPDDIHLLMGVKISVDQIMGCS